MASSEVLGRGGVAMEVGARELALGAPPANPAGAGDGPAVLSEDECRELLHRQPASGGAGLERRYRAQLRSS